MSSYPEREVRVDENLHYVKPIEQLVGLQFEKPVLAGDGLTDWTQSSNSKTDSGQYIHEKNEHSNLTGYGPSVSYSGAVYPGDDFNYWLYCIGKQEIVGAKFEEYEVETWNPTETEKTYVAYKRVYEVQPDNPGSGAGGEKLQLGGTFAQKGSVVKGTYNISTGTFTSAEASSVSAEASTTQTKSVK